MDARDLAHHENRLRAERAADLARERRLKVAAAQTPERVLTLLRLLNYSWEEVDRWDDLTRGERRIVTPATFAALRAVLDDLGLDDD